MDIITTRLIDLPTTIHGCTIQTADGDYVIIINSRIGYGKQVETYAHEMRHIANNDFEKHDVQSIEADAHRM